MLISDPGLLGMGLPAPAPTPCHAQGLSGMPWVPGWSHSTLAPSYSCTSVNTRAPALLSQACARVGTHTPAQAVLRQNAVSKMKSAARKADLSTGRGWRGRPGRRLSQL